jgi:phenylacetate-CoA ligase
MTGHEAPIGDPAVELLERDDVLALQRRKLAALGARLERQPEWRDHLARAGLRGGDFADPTAFAQVPTLEKADLHALAPFPLLGVEVAAVARFFATSGTTGLPVMFGFTRRDLDELLPRQMARVLTCAGVRAGERAYQGYGYGLWVGGPAFEIGLRAVDAVTFPIGPGRGELVVQWLRDHGYTVCTTSPLWPLILTALAREHGIDPRKEWKLRIGIFGGQSISTALRDQIEAEMPPGFTAHNCYGTTEAGGPVVAISCPYSHDRDQMHLINEDTVLTEILDPATLAPAGPGEVGEIVITTLEKEASPVVRWRTRDLVRRARDPYGCPCGRKGLPLIERLIGRTDDMLKVRGVIVFPSQIEDVIAATEGTVKEAWQIYLDRAEGMLEEVTVAIERAPDARRPPEILARALADSLSARLGIRVNVDCYDPGSLPRYEGKAQRVQVRESG